MLDSKLMEAIDACRPDSRDVDQPELASLAAALSHDPQVRAVYDAIQQSDGRLTSAMHDVPVPTGLADRILDRLAATVVSSDATATSGTAAAIAVEAKVPVISGEPKMPSSIEADSASRSSRRRVVAVGLGLAACLLLAAGLGVLVGRQPDHSQLAVTEKAVGWYEQLGDGWQPVDKAPKGFSLPKGIGGTLRGWQWLAKGVAKSGVVYDLGQNPPGQVLPGQQVRGAQKGAVLFVIKATRTDLPSSAPRTPQSTTAGFAIGAWQSGGLMYVLVVRGNEHDYQRLLHPVQPLA
jgi:hypothetical protein